MTKWDISIRSTLAGIACFNTFVLGELDDQVAVPVEPSTVVRNSWVSTIMDLMSSDLELNDVTSITDTGVTTITPGLDNGNVQQSALVVNNCLNMIKQTQIGRNGRCFISGAPENEVASDGQLKVPYHADFQNALTQFQQDLALGNLQMFKALSIGPGSFVNVGSLRAGTFVVRQSRRLDRARY